MSRPHGTCPPNPEKALIWLHEAISEAVAARDMEAVALALEEAQDIVEKLRLSPVE